MKNFVKNSAVKVKNHVWKHKLNYTVIGAAIGIEVVRARQWNEFLTEKGLMDEFYKTGAFKEVTEAR